MTFPPTHSPAQRLIHDSAVAIGPHVLELDYDTQCAVIAATTTIENADFMDPKGKSRHWQQRAERAFQRLKRLGLDSKGQPL